METGIIFERSAARPFAVSLANAQTPGLPEHIWRDDVQVLREEWAVFMSAYAISRDVKCKRKADETEREIKIRLAQAQADGFDTKGW